MVCGLDDENGGMAWNKKNPILVYSNIDVPKYIGIRANLLKILTNKLS